MGASAPLTLRTPLILLAAANLVFLGMRLWPWQDVVANLPGNGATGIDPAVCLLAYMGLIFWIATNHHEPIQKALSSGTMLGLLAGCILVAEVMFKDSADTAGISHPRLVRMGLMAAAGVVWGIAGLRGSKAGGNAGIGMLSGLWAAMASSLMACSAVLASLYLAAPVPDTTDPWKEYEGLAIGNPATQALVHSLNSATAFLLIGPLVGAVLGLLFAFSAQSGKD